MAKGAYIGVNNVARKMKKGYIGVNNVARKIKKAYIGIGGVARPCWSGGELSYYGPITSLSDKKLGAATAVVGDYALFASGRDNASYTFYPTVDAYNASLVKSSAPPCSTGREGLVGASVGNYAIFTGGAYTLQNYGVQYADYGDAYSSSLTQTTLSNNYSNLLHCGVTTDDGNYALFGGGNVRQTPRSTVVCYTTSLGFSIVSSSLSVARFSLGAVRVPNSGYVLFGGGSSYDRDYNTTYLSNVDIYNNSLSRLIGTALSVARNNPMVASVGTYGLFAGGKIKNSPYSYAGIDAFDGSLTCNSSLSLSVNRSNGTGVSLGNYALFAGGHDGNDASTVIDVFDASLTRTMQNLGTKRAELLSSAIRNFAIFAGGYNKTDGYLTTAEAFTIA